MALNAAALKGALKTILVVEDKDEVRQAICATLETCGYVAVGAANGREALDIVQASRPDIVLTDVMMPRMTGYEFVGRLRKVPGCAELRVILMSSIDPALHPHGRWDAVLHKPFSSEALLTALEAFPPRGQVGNE